MPNEIAKPGTIFVCRACGKTSRDRYGDQAISAGWDESCMSNAVLCHEEKQRGCWLPVSVPKAEGGRRAMTPAAMESQHDP